MQNTLDNVAKERRSRYFDPGQLFFGRDLSVVRTPAGAAAVSLIEHKGRTALLFAARQHGVRTEKRIRTSGHAYAPVLAGDPQGRLAVVWLETASGAWRIRAARLDSRGRLQRTPETIHESASLIAAPSAVFHEGLLHVAWSGLGNDGLRIQWTAGRAGVWAPPVPVSEAGLDAFRPTLCAAGNRLLLAWDQYRDQRYEVVWATALSGQSPVAVATLSDATEHWRFPRLAANAAGIAFMTWHAELDVADDRGIADHAGFAMAARIEAGEARILGDANQPGASRRIADLREGMLAARCYKGYLGHRRRPLAAVSDAGACWLLWEVRPEDEQTGIAGHLAARRHLGDGRWTEPVFIADGGYAYATAAAFADGELPLARLVYANAGHAILDLASADPARGRAYHPDPQRWAHWRPATPAPQAKPRRTITHRGRWLALYWADTHVHSRFSADAEGEADELIHFARDRAGLDAVAITDNDIYPHKPLFRAEWEMHRELCRRFTQEGSFVLFHGYEFTFHDANLRPDFNHRIVLHSDLSGGLWRRIDSGSHDLAGLYRQLAERGAMCYPHHCSFALTDPAREWNIEACSSWRVCLAESDFAVRQLRQGARFGFIGSSDTHRLVPGLGGALTGLYAESLTREALFDAYRNRRLVATQGFPVFIDFRVNGHFVGEAGRASSPIVIRAEVEADDPIETIEIVRDGEPIHAVCANGARQAETTFTDRGVADGEHFYFLRVRLVGEAALNFDPSANALAPFTTEGRYPHNLAKARGVWAWTSPVWLRVSNGGPRAC